MDEREIPTCAADGPRPNPAPWWDLSVRLPLWQWAPLVFVSVFACVVWARWDARQEAQAWRNQRMVASEQAGWRSGFAACRSVVLDILGVPSVVMDPQVVTVLRDADNAPEFAVVLGDPDASRASMGCRAGWVLVADGECVPSMRTDGGEPQAWEMFRD